MRYRGIGILFLMCAVASCNAPGRFTDTAISMGESPSVTPIHPTEKTPPPILPPSPASVACPVDLGAPAIPALQSPADWATDLHAYLNQGGSVSGLLDALPEIGQDDPMGLGAAAEDLDGDGFEDFVVTLMDRNAQDAGQISAESTLLIFHCNQDQYRLVHAANTMPEAGRYHLSQLIDVTGDGVQELLVMQEFCGAHTCFQAWEVLQWQVNHYENVLEGRSDDLPSPVLEISGPEEDGSMTLTITGTGILSAGAGPSRASTRVWHWSESHSRFSVAEELLSPPSFRIHALHDADQAAYLGEFDTALSGYMRVIEDATLDDYPFGDDGHTRLSAYALYRMILLWIQFGDLDQAASTFSFLQEAHPAGSPGEGYSALAEEVWQAYQVQPDLPHVCRIAQAYASVESDNVLAPLNYGYANKLYTPTDICPYTE